MKKFFVPVLVIVGFALVPHVFAATSAAQFVPLAPIPNLTDSTTATQLLSGSFAQFFNSLYKYLIGVAVVIAVGLIIWSGIQIAMNKDSVSKTLASRGRINNAIFGLILVLAPALVFSIINPSILNLKIDISKVDLSYSTEPTETTTVSNNSQVVKYDVECARTENNALKRLTPYDCSVALQSCPVPRPGYSQYTEITASCYNLASKETTSNLLLSLDGTPVPPDALLSRDNFTAGHLFACLAKTPDSGVDTNLYGVRMECATTSTRDK